MRVPPYSSLFQTLRVNGRRPLLPPGTRLYAIGDIHGRLDLLEQLLAKVAAGVVNRPAVRPVCVFLGDYIDRGPASRETIDRLIAHGEAHESVFMKGNHEQVALKCLNDPKLFESWMSLGGIETLRSYKAAPDALIRARRVVELQAAFHNALPRMHLRFFGDLQSSFTCGDFFFVHAGVKPGIDLTQQDERDLLWIRDEFLSSDKDFGKIIVHGHTPTHKVDVRPNRINIDTGAFATGCLTSLVIDDHSLSLIDTAPDP